MPLPAVWLDWVRGTMVGDAVRKSTRKLGALKGVFHDTDAWHAMDQDAVVYSVEFWQPVPEGTEGGLFWGVTTIKPGVVGDEYFMTQGHAHAVRERSEFYGCASGEGMLVLMDSERRTRVETMTPGSLHYIPACTAHRVVNTGDVPLSFWACWPSDAGHDYDMVLREGFSARVLRREGIPTVVEELR